MEKKYDSSDTSALKERIDINSKNASYNLEDWMIKEINPVKGMKILDLGCGTGKQIYAISGFLSNEAVFLGIDISKEAVDNVNKTAESMSFNNIKAINASFEEIEDYIENEMFDLIISSYAIYYSNDVLGLIVRLKENLNDKGSIFVCGPGEGTNAEMADLLRSMGSKINANVDDFLNRADIEKIGKNFSGYKIITLENKITFNSPGEVISWWKNHVSYVPELENKVKEFLNSYFRNHNHYILTKNVLGVHFFK